MSDFLPLTAPRVPSNKQAPAEPATWYKVIAPQFPAAPTAPEDDTPTLEEPDGTRKAHFSSVDEIADRERRRRRPGEPEPREIREMRESAAEQARVIVADARRLAGSILQESREEGYRAGYEAGFASGEQEATRQVTQRANDEREAHGAELSAFIADMEATSRRAWAEMEPEIIGLVFEIARKVIKMEVEINRDAAIEVVKNALRRVADTTSLRIRVHADDLQTVRANREELYTLVDNIRQVEIVEDRRVGPGGCIVETDAGTIDARIETQLAEVRKLLEQTVSEREVG